MQLQT